MKGAVRRFDHERTDSSGRVSVDPADVQDPSFISIGPASSPVTVIVTSENSGPLFLAASEVHTSAAMHGRDRVQWRPATTEEATMFDRLDVGLPRSSGPVDLLRAMEETHTPGISIALLDGGAITETRQAGVARAGSDAPISEHTLFQAGSISKSVAAACALRLVADGRLDLDEDVNDRLASWRIPSNDGWAPRVTLRHLLSHTAGLTVNGFAGYPTGTGVPSTVDVLNGLGNTMPVVVAGLPGLGYSYSGGGYTVIQQLLVDVTGKDFPALAGELVLDPVGMRDSTYAQPLPPDRAGDAASGHHMGPVMVPGGWHTYPEMAAAGLWSTAADLARFFLAVRASVLGHDGALLPQRLAEQMVAPAHPTSGYGLGLELTPPESPRTIGHRGNTQGFENWARIAIDSGRGAVIMTNGYFGLVLIHAVLVPVLSEAFGWSDPPGPSPAPAPTAPTRYGDFLVEPVDGQLRVAFRDQAPLMLSFVDGGYWSSREANIDVRFEPDALIATQDGAETRIARS
jgi:CubicO group peptidase (beta-lactamase class C family)